MRFISFGVGNNNELPRTIQSLLTENKRVLLYGFTPTEFERAKAEYLRGVEKQYAERDKMENDAYVWQYFSNFLEQEPAPGVEFDYAFSNQVVPAITLEEVNALATQWITDKNMVISVMALEAEGITVPHEQEIRDIIAAVKAENVQPYVDKVSDKPLIAEEPMPMPVDKKGKDKTLGTVEWTFENGVKVVMKQTDFKEDEVLLQAYSYGGSSLYPIKDLISVDFATQVVYQSGLGEFDRIALDKMLSGKIINLSPFISENAEGFYGNCSAKDLETMLQMIYLYFTAPRADETAYNSFMKMAKAMLDNRAVEPESALQDTAMVLLANHNPRVRPMTSGLLAEASLKRARSIFKERFGDPGSFTFYFVGNIDPATAKPMMEKYLGGLPKVVQDRNMGG